MDALRRIRPTSVALLVALAGLAAPAAAQTAPPRCLQDALERWFCAADPKGAAVIDNLGKVVCAPGRCARLEDEWLCSSVSGGEAAVTPDGPVCAGECRAPRAVDCDSTGGP